MAVTYFAVVCHGVSEIVDPKSAAVLKWAVREILLKMRGPHRRVESLIYLSRKNGNKWLY